MLDNKPLEYIKLLPTHHDAVLEHLRNTFFADEPLNKGTKLCQRGEGHPELEKVVSDTLQDDISIVAVTKEGDVCHTRDGFYTFNIEDLTCRSPVLC